jgi:hypothetical protein
MTRKKSAKEPDKAQRLSLAELAAHDDVCSDVMVDNVSNLNLLQGLFALTTARLITSPRFERTAPSTFPFEASRRKKYPRSFYTR